LLVREKGLEPSRLAALAPKASVSTIPPLARAQLLYQMRARLLIQKRSCLQNNQLLVLSKVINKPRRELWASELATPVAMLILK
jgi:hypothetical protein